MSSVTLREVAERAGVSMSTVSRVLGGTYPTAPATQAKVMRAARELDYVANAQARALAGGGIQAVAVLVTSVTSEFHAYVVKGIEEQATEEGRVCLIGVTGRDAQREAALVQMMREQRAPAVFLVGGAVVDEHYQTRMTQSAHALAAAGSRLVLVGRPPLTPDVPVIAVDYDNAGGAYGAISYLLSQGHRRILYLGVGPPHTTFQARLEGYRRALTDHGVGVDESLVVHGWPGRPLGYQTVRDRVAHGAGELDFTAIFAVDDETAVGARSALLEQGLRIPDDVSLVGYNDMPIAADLGLTTVHIPNEELGRTAARLAFHSDDARGNGPVAIHRVLGTHLVIRDSVRPPVATASR